MIDISRSGYYAWLQAGRPQPHGKDAVLLAHIRQVERENDHNYGVQKVYEELNAKGIRVGRSKVQRVMHEQGIKAQLQIKYKPQTTKSDPDEKAFANLLEQDFGTQEINQVWLADITYVRIQGKWSYLAGVLDLARRKLIGWALGSHPTAGLACQALRMAVAKEQPKEGLIHHSDRGSQYTASEYKQLLSTYKMRGSMSRKGNPYDNAPMESFFRILKAELIYKRNFTTIAQAASSLQSWFVYYNTRRRHSSLGGISPLLYEIRRFHSFFLSV